MNSQVYLVRTTPIYPDYPYSGERSALAEGLGSLFSLWGRDLDNPFSDWIHPNGCALIKPNWVFDRNPEGYGIDSLITHPSLIRLLIDFLAKAMERRGTIIIGDAPIQGCDFNRLIRESRIVDVLEEAKKQYPSLNIIVEDWRLTILEKPTGRMGWLSNGSQLSHDAKGKSASENHCVIDVGEKSFLEEIAEYSDRFRVAMYDPEMMAAHHRPGKHEYLVTRRIFDADLVINLPKMKTHAKAGLTGALKNVVGINGHKEYLPHHIMGSYFDGGDNYCSPNLFRRKYEQLNDHLWKNYTEMTQFHRMAYTYGLKALWKLSQFSQLRAHIQRKLEWE